MKLHPFNIMQRSACGGLDMGSDFDCDNPITAGVNQRLILIDKTVYDRALVTEDPTTAGLIDSITLTQVGDAGYSFQGVRKSLNPSSEFIPSSVVSGFGHIVDFICFDISQEQKNNIQKMAAGKLVAIIENANTVGNSNSVFEIYGKGVGLELQAGTLRENGSNETGGGYTLSLKTSPDFGQEPKLPASYLVTDYAGTILEIETILTPVVTP